MSKLTGKNLIGYKESSKGSHTYTAINPKTQVPLETEFYETTLEEVNEAVEMAEKSFIAFKNISGEQKALFLEKIAEEILAIGDILIQRCVEETALPEARLTGERMRTVNQLKLFASFVREGSWVEARIDTAIPDRQPAPKPDIRQMQTPLGPVGIFGASNFPLAFSVAGGDTTSALAAGCPVVVKAHPLHPGTSELVGKAILSAIRKTNMPEGIFSLLHGVSTEAGMALVKHPKITAIGFTGSFRGGKALFDAANQRDVPIPVYAEMGSVNPVFILPGAMKERNDQIAKGLVGSFTLGVGQFCTSPGLIITPPSKESQQFLKTVASQVEALPSGPMLSANIKSNFQSGIRKLKDSKGVTLLGSSQQDETGYQVRSKVFTADFNTFINDKTLSEEVFGPSTLIVQATKKEEIYIAAEALDGHLTITIHGTEEDLSEFAGLIPILERKAGRLIFNGFPTGVEVCHSMVHGGPYPATTASQTTSVGTLAIRRFSRPVCYQDFPESFLPDELKNRNPKDIWRLVNGEWTKKMIE